MTLVVSGSIENSEEPLFLLGYLRFLLLIPNQ